MVWGTRCGVGTARGRASGRVQEIDLFLVIFSLYCAYNTRGIVKKPLPLSPSTGILLLNLAITWAGVWVIFISQRPGG